MGTQLPLKRKLGLFEVTFSGIGIILGAGIFALVVEGVPTLFFSLPIGISPPAI